MRLLAIALLAAGLVLGPTTGHAQKSESPGALAAEGVAKLVDALRHLLESVPKYEATVINKNGDIIIRRRRPEATPPAPPTEKPAEKGKPELDET